MHNQGHLHALCSPCVLRTMRLQLAKGSLRAHMPPPTHVWVMGGCCTEWPSWEGNRLMACGALGRSWDISAAIALQIASGACLLVPWWPGGRGATPRPSSRIVVASSSFVEPPFARPHGQGNEAETNNNEFSYVVPRSQTDCGITRSNCLDWMQQWKRHN